MDFRHKQWLTLADDCLLTLCIFPVTLFVNFQSFSTIRTLSPRSVQRYAVSTICKMVCLISKRSQISSWKDHRVFSVHEQWLHVESDLEQTLGSGNVNEDFWLPQLQTVALWRTKSAKTAPGLFLLDVDFHWYSHFVSRTSPSLFRMSFHKRVQPLVGVMESDQVTSSRMVHSISTGSIHSTHACDVWLLTLVLLSS